LGTSFVVLWGWWVSGVVVLFVVVGGVRIRLFAVDLAFYEAIFCLGFGGCLVVGGKFRGCCACLPVSLCCEGTLA